VGVSPTAPTELHVSPDPLRGDSDGGHAAGPAFVGEGVTSCASELAIGESLLAGLLERDEREAAKSKFSAAATDGEPLDPTPATGWLNIEVQAVTVAVAPGLGNIANEGR